MEKRRGHIASVKFGWSFERGFKCWRYGVVLKIADGDKEHGWEYAVEFYGHQDPSIRPSLATADYPAHQFEDAMRRMAEEFGGVLDRAGVNDSTQLIGVPVEISLKHGVFKSWRILKEVI